MLREYRSFKFYAGTYTLISHKQGLNKIYMFLIKSEKKELFDCLIYDCRTVICLNMFMN